MRALEPPLRLRRSARATWWESTRSRRGRTTMFLTLRHEAHSRRGFAEGAVRAAEWIAGKTGCWDFEEIVGAAVGGLSGRQSSGRRLAKNRRCQMCGTRADRLRGIAGADHHRGQIFEHDAAGADDRAAPDRDSGADEDAGRQPDFRLDRDEAADHVEGGPGVVVVGGRRDSSAGRRRRCRRCGFRPAYIRLRGRRSSDSRRW